MLNKEHTDKLLSQKTELETSYIDGLNKLKETLENR